MFAKSNLTQLNDMRLRAAEFAASSNCFRSTLGKKNNFPSMIYFSSRRRIIVFNSSATLLLGQALNVANNLCVKVMLLHSVACSLIEMSVHVFIYSPDIHLLVHFLRVVRSHECHLFSQSCLSIRKVHKQRTRTLEL